MIGYFLENLRAKKILLENSEGRACLEDQEIESVLIVFIFSTQYFVSNKSVFLIFEIYFLYDADLH